MTTDFAVPLVVGLDPESPARMVSMYAGLTLGVYDRCAFEDLLSFQEYWEEHFAEEEGLRVTVPAEATDPLGILEWLTGEGHRVERYPVRADPYFADELVARCLPADYARAYSVAQTATYRTVGPALLLPIYDELKRLRDSVDRQLDTVRARIPCEFLADHDPYWDIPF